MTKTIFDGYENMLHHCGSTEVYVMFGGVLTAVKYVKTLYDIGKDDDGKPCIKASHVLYSVPGEKTLIELSPKHKFYKSAQDYEDGKETVEIEEGYNPFFYRIPEKIYAVEDGCVMEFNMYDYLSSIEVANTAASLKCIPSLPAEWYDNREEAIKYNEYTVKESDGTTHKESGYASKMRYNEGQQKLIDEFMSLMERMGNEDLEVMWHSEGESILFAPRNAYERIDWGRSKDEDVIQDREVCRFLKYYTPTFFGSEDTFIFKKKNANKEDENANK